MKVLIRILEGWLKGEKPLVTRAWGSLLGYLLYIWRKDLPQPPLIVLPEEMGEEWVGPLSAFQETIYMPPWDSDPSSGIPPTSWVLGQRMEGLLSLLERSPLLVTTLKGLAQKVMDPDAFVESILVLVKGAIFPRRYLTEGLVKLGYQRVDQVEEPGSFSVKGYVVDVFPINEPLPMRIELWGDEVESIRTFHPQTQTSLKEKGKIMVLPQREMMGEKRVPLTTLIKERPLVLIQPEDVEMERENLLLEDRDFLSPQEIRDFIAQRPTLWVNSLYQEGITLPVEGYPLGLTPLKGTSRIFQGMGWIRSQLTQGMAVYVSHPLGEEDRMARLFKEYDIHPVSLPHFQEQGKGLYLFPSSLTKGFLWPQMNVAFVAQEELLGRKKKKAKRTIKRRGDPLTTLRDLSPEDYVVHLEHGIGRYLGLRLLEVKGVNQEFMVLEYDQGDQLLVPVTRLHMVQKYRGAQAIPPTLDKLGGITWKRTKKRVKKAIEEYARELLRIEAERQITPGHSFSPDTVEQGEFEEEFPFEETPDQEKAVQEIKKDMEAPHPMDRLLCGDVGYGKTEVAMRAAFKAILDGKQVAVLVPTTILAEQHVETFLERFKHYPVNIEVLSRFKTPREQKEILDRVFKGDVDILIGTHRLFSPDVIFRDLGLVIIDEEHRFGVRQKDRLKKLKKGVDVLSLSATPIPRTLHLAISGAKRMSIMETPPYGRRPVKTYISRWNPSIIKRALLKEEGRRGRVFAVQPRVEGLEELLELVKRLTPHLKVAMAHGQMKERELEEVMHRFMKGDVNVLVSTPIVESGLDVPMANTLVVKDAHKLGLSQLYQLRGRVGRSREMGYAYFFIPGMEHLTQEGKKRLQALREFAQLGSGLKLAMRDMEIRGAGNILGTQQWGHASQVGFTLYCQMLEKTIQELQGQEVRKEIEPQLELGVEALLPSTYVGNERAKIALYKRIAQAPDEEKLKGLEEEVRDRFGPLPPPARNLFTIAAIRLIIRNLGGERLVRSPKGLFLYFSPSAALAWEKISSLIKRGKVKVKGEYLMKLSSNSQDIGETKKLLKELHESVSLTQNLNVKGAEA